MIAERVIGQSEVLDRVRSKFGASFCNQVESLGYRCRSTGGSRLSSHMCGLTNLPSLSLSPFFSLPSLVPPVCKRVHSRVEEDTHTHRRARVYLSGTRAIGVQEAERAYRDDGSLEKVSICKVQNVSTFKRSSPLRPVIGHQLLCRVNHGSKSTRVLDKVSGIKRCSA